MSEGNKHDTGKLRYDLLPAYPLRRLVEVYTMGADKYDDRNWEKGITYGRIFAAMMRHAWAWWNGERNDQEDGQHHLASVAWCAFALMQYERTRPEFDDRPEPVNANGEPHPTTPPRSEQDGWEGLPVGEKVTINDHEFVVREASDGTKFLAPAYTAYRSNLNE